MSKKNIAIISSIALFALPTLTLAINFPAMPQGGNINILNVINAVFNILWPVTAAFIAIMFMIAGFEFFTAQGEASKLDKARQMVIWGTVGTIVILLASSMIFVVNNTING